MKLIVLSYIVLLPTLLYGQSKFSWTAHDELQRQLYIPYITSSRNEIDLRIIASESMRTPGHVIWIRKQGESWKGTVYYYSLKPNENGNETSVIRNYTKKKLTTRENWDSFWEKLCQYQILELPDQANVTSHGKVVIKNGEQDHERILVTDGTSYHLVVRMNDKHRSYSFHEPCAYLDFYNDSKELMNYCNIISMIDKAFKIKP